MKGGIVMTEEREKRRQNREQRRQIRQSVRDSARIELKNQIRAARQENFFDSSAALIQERDYIETEVYSQYDVKRGLRNANGTGVLVGLTKVGEVNGYETDDEGNKIPIEGKLYYRGYSIEDLVNSCIAEDRFGFEEITYLLIFGELPSRDELDAFTKFLGNKRELPQGFARDMILTAPSSNIMNKLARSVLALYTYDDKADDISIANVLRQSIDLIGYFPALISYAYQAKRAYYDNDSLHLNNPLPELSTSENILRMLRSSGEYTDLEAKLLDICMILHMEHGGGNNSSFTTHLISSSGTDTYATIAAAIGSLKGPRHGGANVKVIQMLDDLKSNVKDYTNKQQVDNYLRKVLRKEANDGTGLIYGMGHAIYTKSDPRAVVLKKMARQLAEGNDFNETFELCNYIEQRTPELMAEVRGREKPICANVDLYSGFVYTALGIPEEFATPLFAAARICGWCAHRIEELSNGSKLMRPAYKSVMSPRPYLSIDNRITTVSLID